MGHVCPETWTSWCPPGRSDTCLRVGASRSQGGTRCVISCFVRRSPLCQPVTRVFLVATASNQILRMGRPEEWVWVLSAPSVFRAFCESLSQGTDWWLTHCFQGHLPDELGFFLLESWPRNGPSQHVDVRPSMWMVHFQQEK